MSSKQDLEGAGTSRDAEKARRAAAHAERPGERCGAAPGAFRPLVDRARCEAKADCVAVCPYDVFEVRPIAAGDFAELSWLGKLKSVAHGRRSAYEVHRDRCRACGLCVVACPERAIRLVPTVRGPMPEGT